MIFAVLLAGALGALGVVSIQNAMKVNGLALPVTLTGNDTTITITLGVKHIDLKVKSFAYTHPGQPNDPAGTSSASMVMMGISSSAGQKCLFTPTTTGRGFIQLTGSWSENNVGQDSTMNLRYGSGAAPANGAAATGTAVLNADMALHVGAANEIVPFSIRGYITGLTLNTQYWEDASLQVNGGITTQIQRLDCQFVETP